MTKKFRVDANGNVLAHGKQQDSSSSTSSGIIVNGKVQANVNGNGNGSVVESNDSSMGERRPKEKQKLPSFNMSPAFKSNVSSSEPNLAATDDARWPTLRLSVPDVQDDRPALLTHSPFFFEHEKLATVVQPPARFSYTPSPRLSVAVRDSPYSLLEELAAVDQLDAAIAMDEVLQLDEDSDGESPAPRPPLLVHHYEAEVLMPMPMPIQSSLRLQSAPQPMKSRPRKSGKRNNNKPVKRFAALLEEAPASFESEIDADHQSPAQVKVARMLLNKVSVDVGLEYEPESVFDSAVKAHAHRPHALVVLPAPAEPDRKKNRRKKSQLVLPLESLARRLDESTFLNPIKLRPMPRLTISVVKPCPDDSPSLLLLPAPASGRHAATLLQEMQMLLDTPEHADPSAAAFRDELIEESLPFLKTTKNAFYSKGDGVEILHLVCPPHLAPVVDDEVLSRQYFSDEELEDAMFTNKRRHDNGPFTHEFHYAFVPFSVYREWTRRMPDLFVSSQKPIVLDENIAQLTEPPLQPVFYAQVSPCAPLANAFNMPACDILSPRVSVTQATHLAIASSVRQRILEAPKLEETRKFALSSPSISMARPRILETPEIEENFTPESPSPSISLAHTRILETPGIEETIRADSPILSISLARSRIPETLKVEDDVRVASPSSSSASARPSILETVKVQDTVRRASPSPSIASARPSILETVKVQDAVRVASPSPSIASARPRTLETVKVEDAVIVASPSPSIASARPRTLETVRVQDAVIRASPSPSIAPARPSILETVRVQDAVRVVSPSPSIASARPRTAEIKVEEAVRVASPSPSIASARPRIPETVKVEEAVKVDLPDFMNPVQSRNFGAPKVEENIKVALAGPRVAVAPVVPAVPAVPVAPATTTTTATVAPAQRAPIVARVADRTSDRLKPSVAPPKAHYIVVSFNNQHWNPYYRQSHGLVKDCGIGTDDTDDLENFEIDANVIDDLIDDSDSDSDSDSDTEFFGATRNERSFATTTD